MTTHKNIKLITLLAIFILPFFMMFSKPAAAVPFSIRLGSKDVTWFYCRKLKDIEGIKHYISSKSYSAAINYYSKDTSCNILLPQTRVIIESKVGSSIYKGKVRRGNQLYTRYFTFENISYEVPKTGSHMLSHFFTEIRTRYRDVITQLTTAENIVIARHARRIKAAKAEIAGKRRELLKELSKIQKMEKKLKTLQKKVH